MWTDKQTHNPPPPPPHPQQAENLMAVDTSKTQQRSDQWKPLRRRWGNEDEHAPTWISLIPYAIGCMCTPVEMHV